MSRLPRPPRPRPGQARVRREQAAPGEPAPVGSGPDPALLLSWDDPSVRLSLLIVALTIAALLLRNPAFKLLVAVACSLVVLRAVFGVWSLVLVRQGRILEAVQRRLGMYLTGLLSVACTLALMFSVSRH